jgi:hypothetical protein
MTLCGYIIRDREIDKGKKMKDKRGRERFQSSKGILIYLSKKKRKKERKKEREKKKGHDKTKRPQFFCNFSFLFLIHKFLYKCRSSSRRLLS